MGDQFAPARRPGTAGPAPTARTPAPGPGRGPALPSVVGNRAMAALARGGPAARPGTGPPPVITEAVGAEMARDVERIVERLREQILDPQEEWEIVGLVRKWAAADARHRERSGYGGSDHLDRFLTALKLRSYSRRTARSGWLEPQYAIAYDDLWHELEGERLDAFGALVAQSRREATAGPGSGPSENVWATVGWQEAIGLWGMLKGMGTGAAGMVDEGAWAVTKALRARGIDAADPASAAAWLEQQFDQSGEIMFGTDWKQSEELFLGLRAADIGTAGGQIIWQLTMAKAGKGAPAWAQRALWAFGVAGNLKGVNDSATAIADLIAARQRQGTLSAAALLSDPAFMQEATKLAANVYGAISAGKGTNPQLSQATAAALSRTGILLDAAQAAPQLGRLVEIAASDLDPKAKQEATGRVVLGLVQSAFTVGAGVAGHREEHGHPAAAPPTRPPAPVAKAGTPVPAAASATTGAPPAAPPPGRPPSGPTRPPRPTGPEPPAPIVGEPALIHPSAGKKVIPSTLAEQEAKARQRAAGKPVVLTDERGNVPATPPAPKGKKAPPVGLVDPLGRRVVERGKRAGETVTSRNQPELLGPDGQPLRPTGPAAKPPPQRPKLLGPDEPLHPTGPAQRPPSGPRPGYVAGPTKQETQAVPGVTVGRQRPLDVPLPLPAGPTVRGDVVEPAVIHRSYPDGVPLPRHFPDFDVVLGGTVTTGHASRREKGQFPQWVRIEGGTAINVKSVDLTAKSYRNARDTFATLKTNYVNPMVGFPERGNSTSMEIGGQKVTYTLVNPAARVLHLEFTTRPNREQMDGLARLRNYAADRGIQLILVTAQ
jgi:hypothetical protein